MNGTCGVKYYVWIFNLSQKIICPCYNETLSWVWWLCVGTGTGGDCDPPRLQPGTLGGKYIPIGQYLMNPLMVPVWL